MKAKYSSLTKEERDVLIVAAPHPGGRRLSDIEIGQRLGISVTKVKTLIQRACAKLNAHNRNEAIYFAVIRREITPDEILTLDELAEFISDNGPDRSQHIAYTDRKELGYDYIKYTDEHIIFADRTKSSILTNSERDVLILAAPHPGGQNLCNNEIGQRLGIPVTKVKTLIRQACVKLGANNKYEAGIFAIQQGEIKLEEVYSLNELADLLSSIHPDRFRELTRLDCEEVDHKDLSINDDYNNYADRRQDAILTKCEQDVLKLVGRGLTNKEIADELCISTSTVRSFLYRACSKLGAHTRVEAVALALKLGEVSFDQIYSLNELVRTFATLEAESIEKVAQLLAKNFKQEPVSIRS